LDGNKTGIETVSIFDVTINFEDGFFAILQVILLMAPEELSLTHTTHNQAMASRVKYILMKKKIG
jgi:hypothetical protein